MFSPKPLLAVAGNGALITAALGGSAKIVYFFGMGMLLLTVSLGCVFVMPSVTVYG